MPRINEATDTDLKVFEDLTKLGWKRGDTLLYQQEYALTPEQQKLFDRKSVKPDFTLQDLNGNIVAVIENKFEDEKKALTKLRSLYAVALRPRFLYACSPKKILLNDTSWKGLDAGEFHQVNSFMSLEEMKLKIEQDKQRNLERDIVIDKNIAGGMNPNCGKETYFQTECINTLIQNFKEGKQKMLVHMATGLGKTRTMVAFTKALMQYNMAKRVLFVVDRIMLADQAITDGFSLISNEFTSVRIRTSNYRLYKNTPIHVVVIDTLENIYENIPSTFYDLIIVDECHRSININRKLIFDHFLCPRIGLTATPRQAIAAKGKDISEDDLAILDTYKLFGCEVGNPDYQFDLGRGIDEGFLAPYDVFEIKTELTKQAETDGVEFDYVLDMDTREIFVLEQRKKLYLEQLERKYISEERCMRIAEELKSNTQYGEKIILFGVSQAHCILLTKAINKVFSMPDDEASPRYAEAIISDNNDLNSTFKKWFKDKSHKPYIAVSVDIMTTGVDIPCVRFISFAALTKSVGKYIQMLGRGTRFDPKSGKFSFRVLDFVGLCKKMGDNGKGTKKENKYVYQGIGGKTPEPPGPKGDVFLIDNPDPAHLIQRVFIHGDNIRVIDNIPINSAKEIFETELLNSLDPTIQEIKNKVKENFDYTPTLEELDLISEWAKNPAIYLDESQLQKIYDYKQGSFWDFFLHALKIKNIPTPEERIEKGFDSYLKTYNLTDEQINYLRNIKDIVLTNIKDKKVIKPEEIFNIPFYSQLIGGDYNYLNQKFDYNFARIYDDLQNSFKI